MAEGGIDDILIAFPIIGEDKLEHYGVPSEKCTLRSIVNSVIGARGLSGLGRRLGKKLEVLIEIDGGVPPEEALDFARSRVRLDGIEIVGFLYYRGPIYNEETDEGLERVARLEREHRNGEAARSSWVRGENSQRRKRPPPNARTALKTSPRPGPATPSSTTARSFIKTS